MITRLHLLLAFSLLGSSAFAQLTADQETPEMKDITFEQKLDAQVPLDLEFRNSDGRMMTLREAMLDGKPAVLTLVYYECPMLCNLIMNGTLKALQNVPYQIGQDFTVLTVSFDHEETHVLAAAKKENYVEELDHKNADAGWYFMVGGEENIAQVAESVGFTFEYQPETGEYAHRSAIMILTPEGRVSRYFPGVNYPDRDFRFGLVDASDGKIGSVVDRVFMLCYHYDPTMGQYSLLVNRVVNTACAITVIAVASLMYFLMRREKRIRRSLPENSEGSTTTSTS